MTDLHLFVMVPGARPTQSQTLRTGLIVPLYIYPAPGKWEPLIAAKQANPQVPILAIVNPGSGPGSRTDPLYVAGMAALREAGIMAFAYVYSSYRRRSYDEVTNDIDAYTALYGRNFDGIFVDEMAKDDAAHYESVASHARSGGFGRVIGNPGTDVPKEYVGKAADVFVIYENAGSPSPTFLGGWHAAYPKQTWAFIAHHTASLDPSLVAKAKMDVGLLYLTDADYHSFPPYLGRLCALL